MIPPHMSAEEFRRYGHELIDWIARYWQRLPDLPVVPDTRPGSVAAGLPAKAPERGSDLMPVIADLDRVIVPGLTHWQHPDFYGYFPANTSGPSVLADLVCAGLGVQGMLWATSPACTELETVMLDWLAGLLALPQRFHSSGSGGGVIQDSASSANLVAVLAALHRASGGEWGTAGVDRRYTVYTSTHGHSSIEKAARIAGIGDAQVRVVEVDQDSLAMRPEALRAAMDADREAGFVPAIVVATVGTTSTTAVDPVAQIGRLCQELGVWLHVDAAYAGAAAVCPELRWAFAGLELADSFCFDPHKWLLTGFDCDAFWVANRAELIQALSVLPDYLRNAASASGAVIDYRDWQVPLGRRFRALKLWFVLRWYGAEGLRAHIRSGVAMAQELASWIQADERFEIVAPHPFSLVCFRLRDTDDAANEQLLQRLNGSGAMFLTHSTVRGQYVLRLAVGSPNSTLDRLRETWARIQDLASK